MIHQRNKDLIFLLTKYGTRFLRPYYLIKYHNKKNLALHLGSSHNIIAGFINIDGNPLRKNTMYFDIRNKLPFGNNAVSCIFVSNVFEHFFPDEIELVIKDIYRCLSNGGIMRIVVPDLEKAISAYNNKDYKFFHDFPRSYKSLGGRFSNAMFCDAQHRLAYDFSYMSELLAYAGFNLVNIQKLEYGSSNLPSIIYEKIKPFETHFAKTDLFVEVKK